MSKLTPTAIKVTDNLQLVQTEDYIFLLDVTQTGKSGVNYNIATNKVQKLEHDYPGFTSETMYLYKIVAYHPHVKFVHSALISVPKLFNPELNQ